MHIFKGLGLLVWLIFVAGPLSSFADGIPQWCGTLVMGPEDETFCYQTHPIDKNAPLSPLNTPDTLVGETVEAQTLEAFELLHTMMREDRLEGTFGELTDALVKLYGNLRYLQATGQRRAEQAENETAYKVLRHAIFLGKAEKPSRKLKRSRLKKIAELVGENGRILSDTKQSTCRDEYQGRLRDLGKKAFLKGPLIATGNGAIVTLGSAAAMEFLGREAIVTLVELFGKQVLAAGIGTIPFAGGVLAASVALITYEGIVISKLIKTAKAFHLVDDAFAGQGKRLIRWVKELEQANKKRTGRTLPPSFTQTDSKTKVQLAAHAIQYLDRTGGLCDGQVKRSSIPPTEDQSLWVAIRNKYKPIERPINTGKTAALVKHIRNYLLNNPDLLAMPLRRNFIPDAASVALSVEGKVLALPPVESLVLDIRNDAGKGKLALFTREWNISKEIMTSFKALLKKGYKPGDLICAEDWNEMAQRTINVNGLVTSEGGLGHFDTLTVKEAIGKKGSGLNLSTGGMVVGFNVKVMPEGKLGRDMDSDFEACVLATQNGEVQTTDISSEHQIHAQITENGDALKLPSLRQSLRASRAMWVTDLMVKDGWKRIISSIPVSVDGEIGNLTSIKECHHSAYAFPAVRSIFTGHLRLELGIK